MGLWFTRGLCIAGSTFCSLCWLAGHLTASPLFFYVLLRSKMTSIWDVATALGTLLNGYMRLYTENVQPLIRLAKPARLGLPQQRPTTCCKLAPCRRL